MLLRGRDRRLLLAVLLASGVLVTWLAATRSYLTYGVETDFLANYLQEAGRLRATGRLEIGFHPPLYPTLLALVWSLLGDGVAAGLVLSVVASVVAGAASWSLYRRVSGGAAAMGALAALVTSRTFVTLGSQATMDMVFLALYQLALLAVFVAAEAPYSRRWLVAGVLAGLVVLTRTNGISVAAVLVVPLWLAPVRGRRRRATLFMLLGLALPLAIWVGYALAMRVPILPGGHVGNLVMTYFAPRDVADLWDVRNNGQAEFGSVLDVFRHDPRHVVVTYGRNLIWGLKEDLLVGELTSKPLGLLALPALVVLVSGRLGRKLGALSVVLIAQLLLVNAFLYSARFHLFLLPFYGACAGITVTWLWRRSDRHWWRRILAATLIVLVCLGCLRAARTANWLNHASDVELDEVVQRATAVVEPGTVMAARKPHVPYYLECTQVRLPASETVADLRETLRSLGEPVRYLFFGSPERGTRPGLASLAGGEPVPSWLQPLATSRSSGDWVLYEVQLQP